jgi:hypothetical protein
MEEGDHSGCMIELLACPEHRDEQLRAMQKNDGQVLVCPEDNVCLGCGLPMNTHDYEQCMNISRPKPDEDSEEIGAADLIAGAVEGQDEPLLTVPHCERGCADADPDNVGAWCMWCDHVYLDYSPTTEDQHFARYCPDAPQQLKDSAMARMAPITPAQSEGES